ncbi:MAG: relaxase domain-containing protein, partial [Acidobacteria bacterium]|nr:relaxase domain-containing protein [Acidobacteriota bacterium]
MLRLSKAPLNAAQVRSYHEREFVNAEQRYYSEDNTVRGEWQGALAIAWGLAGGVRDDQFYRLAEGQHPVTDEQLVRHRFATEYKNQYGETVESVEHRAGWDATFNAPKSISITALVGGDEQVREAHRESVRLALEELERYVQARIGGNHPAETTGKMIAAKFEHDNARPVDGYAAPHLHTHVVIFNVTETLDGKTHSLQPRELYRSQRFATAVYQSELVSRLRQLCYEIERDANGTPQIMGYTLEYLKASSPRRKQIEEYLAKQGTEGYAAAQIAAHRTREAKINLHPEDMQWVNRALAAQYGNDPEAVVNRAKARRQQLEQEPVSRDEAMKTARAALTFARDRNIEREAVVIERKLIEDALRRSLGEARLSELRTALESRIRKGELVYLRTAPNGDRMLTTAQMLAYERENLSTIVRGRDQLRAMVRPERIESLYNELKGLNPTQHKAVVEVLQSPDQVTGLQGAAGSGKTTVLSTVRQIAEGQGYEVQGFAPTSRAARLLEDAGIRSSTLQEFLIKGHEARVSNPRVYVLDESSLASTKQVNEFFKRLERNDRVLLVGDIRQLQAVEAGRPFEQFQEAGMRTVRLEEIIRQQDPQLKQAVELLVEGRAREAIVQLSAQGRVHEIPNGSARLNAVVADYLREPEKSLIISPDNRSRTAINRMVHSQLQNTGKISTEEHVVRVLVNRHDLTGADRQWAAKYKPGNVIRYTRGSKVLGFEKGEFATVTEIDLRRNHVTVERHNGQEVSYNPRRLQGVNVYEIQDREFSKGDRIQFTAPFRKDRIANRELATIERIDRDGNLRLRLESGRHVEFNLREHPHLDYGYAMTSYSSQGQTANRVIVHVAAHDLENRELVNRRFAYVALSRAREEAQVYTNDAATLASKLDR